MGSFTHFVNEESFTELFCQSPEPGGDQLLFQTLAAAGERALAEGFGSLGLPLSHQWFPASLLPKGRNTPDTPSLTAYSDLRH